METCKQIKYIFLSDQVKGLQEQLYDVMAQIPSLNKIPALDHPITRDERITFIKNTYEKAQADETFSDTEDMDQVAQCLSILNSIEEIEGALNSMADKVNLCKQWVTQQAYHPSRTLHNRTVLRPK